MIVMKVNTLLNNLCAVAGVIPAITGDGWVMPLFSGGGRQNLSMVDKAVLYRMKSDFNFHISAEDKGYRDILIASPYSSYLMSYDRYYPYSIQVWYFWDSQS